MARISLVRQIEEPQFASVIAKELGKQRAAVFKEIQKDNPQFDELFWDELKQSMVARMVPVLSGIYDRALGSVMGSANLKQDLTGLIASRAIRWARQHAGELVNEITGTTQRTVREALAEFISTPGMVVRDLRDMLSSTFSAVRAETIAVTEFTRAHFFGQKDAADTFGREGFEMIGVWRTANDDRVCPICGPLEGQYESKPGSGRWGPSGIHPPAHPRCRCDIAYEFAGAPPASLGAQEEAQPLAPLTRAPTPEEIVKFEDSIMGNGRETMGLYAVTPDGVVQIGASTGDENSVNFTDAQLVAIRDARARGAQVVLTHNHPSGLPLSAQDMIMASGNEVGEIRAISPDGAIYGLRIREDSFQGIMERGGIADQFVEAQNERWTELQQPLVEADRADPLRYSAEEWERAQFDALLQARSEVWASLARGTDLIEYYEENIR